MKEIGGFLDLERYQGTEYHEGLLRLNTVRTAVALILKEKNYKKLYIPKYLCNSIQKMLIKFGYEYEYYSINKNLEPIINFSTKNNEAVLIVNYYGKFNQLELKKFQEKYGNIIIDNTHAFFEMPCEGIDTVYTCRKFFGVPDGAYLYLSQTSRYYAELVQDESYQRMTHLLGRYERSASEFYEHFQTVDKLFDDEPIKKMSLLTINMLKSLDYCQIFERRKENFTILHTALKEFNDFDITQNCGLYMYPFLHERGDALRRYLIKQKIYVPMLWPNVLVDNDSQTYEHYLSNNMVLLPIDQRYSKNEMEYIIHLIYEFI